VVVQRMVARQKLIQALEQMFQPQVGADAFVERVFVQDHSGVYRREVAGLQTFIIART
jgi:hypothetical protein